jgi:hypothetical protein
MSHRVIASWVIAALAVSSVPAAAQNLPVDVNKIRSVVEKAPTPALNLEGMRARFYMRVEGKSQIRFTQFIGNFDLRAGPVPGAGMTHAEFMSIVTPKELYSAAGIKPTEALQMALTGWLAQTLAHKAIEDIKKARSDKEIQDIRARIEKELAALSVVK